MTKKKKKKRVSKTMRARARTVEKENQSGLNRMKNPRNNLNQPRRRMRYRPQITLMTHHHRMILTIRKSRRRNQSQFLRKRLKRAHTGGRVIQVEKQVRIFLNFCHVNFILLTNLYKYILFRNTKYKQIEPSIIYENIYDKPTTASDCT